MPTKIPLSIADVSDANKVRIRRSDATSLVNAFIQKPAVTLVELSHQNAPVDLKAVSIDQNGDLVIADKNFRDVVAARLSSEGATATLGDENCFCL